LPYEPRAEVEEACREARAEGLALREHESERLGAEAAERQPKLDELERQQRALITEYQPALKELDEINNTLGLIAGAKKRIRQLGDRLDKLREEIEPAEKAFGQLQAMGWWERRKLRADFELRKSGLEAQLADLHGQWAEMSEEVLKEEEICDLHTPAEMDAMKIRRKALEEQRREFRERKHGIDMRFYEFGYGMRPINPFEVQPDVVEEDESE
jgi:hypothetical protein